MMANNDDTKSMTKDLSRLHSDTRLVCQVCNEQPHKYRCPRCLIHTCCLKCVQEHKKSSGCSGLRDRTAFVPIDDFTDLHLLSDYRLLEDVERQTTLASTLRRVRNTLPYFLTLLLNEARRRGINLRVAPYPLSQRVSNKSYFHKKYDIVCLLSEITSFHPPVYVVNVLSGLGEVVETSRCTFILSSQCDTIIQFCKLKQIEWHVRWTLPHVGQVSSESATLTTITSMVMENVLVKEAVDQLVDHSKTAFPSATQQLQDLLKGDKPVRLFLKSVKTKRYPSSFIELNMDKSLGDNLKGSVVLEQPAIFLSTENLCMQDSPQSPLPSPPENSKHVIF